MEGDDPARGGEHDVLAGRRRTTQPDRDAAPLGVLHLRGDRAHPDQLVEPELVTGQPGRRGRAEPLAGRADRLVRLLGVLDLRLVGAGDVGEVLRTEQLAHLLTRRRDRRLRERHRVGTHVGDEAVLVEPLRDRHRAGGAVAELARGLLLQRRRAERCVGLATIRLRLDRPHRELGVAQRRHQRLCPRPVDVGHAGGLQLTGGREVRASRDSAAVDGVELGREDPVGVVGAGVEAALEIPVRRDAERHALALPVDHQARRDRLHPAGREAAHDLLPEHRGDLVAVEAVEDASGLLGLDEVHVDLPGVLDRLEDRLLGDLVEHHATHGDLRLQLVLEVPGDRLPLAVLIGGEVELVRRP